MEIKEENILRVLDECCDEILDYDGENMVGEGVIDSFTCFHIGNELEEEFGINIDAEYYVTENFRNKEAIVAMVREVEKKKKG